MDTQTAALHQDAASVLQELLQPAGLQSTKRTDYPEQVCERERFKNECVRLWEFVVLSVRIIGDWEWVELVGSVVRLGDWVI